MLNAFSSSKRSADQTTTFKEYTEENTEWKQSTRCSAIKLLIRNTSHKQFTHNLKITNLISILKKLDLNFSQYLRQLIISVKKKKKASK
jgi:hypothetical protein